MNKQPIKEAGKMCYEDCKHGNNEKTRTTAQISCCICAHVFHIDCTECVDPRAVWTCHCCRSMPDTVTQLASKLDHIISQNDRLLQMVLKQQDEIEKLQEAQSQCKSKIMTHDSEMKKAVSRINDPLADSDDEDGDEEEEEAEYSGVLLIGDSMIRNMKSTCNDVEIESCGGAKFNDLKKSLKRINPKQKRYKDLYIVCGTNDCTTKKTAEKITDECKSLLEVAKERAEQVYLSSVLPRLDEKADMVKVNHLNQLLTTEAASLDVSYINNDNNFRYRDFSIDETALSSSDKLHLSHLGVTRLLSNLKLQDKIKPNFGQGPVNRWSNDKQRDRANPPPPISHQITNESQKSQESQFFANPASEVVKFRGITNPLSNFYTSALTVWNVSFKSNEHAYQYRKAVEMGQHVTAENIRKAETPRQAQLLADDIKTDNRWCDMKQSVMYLLLQEKARQCPTFRQRLQECRSKTLVEDTSHEYWGRGRSGDGLNMLGRLLMTLGENLPAASFQVVRAPQAQPATRPLSRTQYPRRSDQQPRCYNCGEKSHTVRTCRHTSPIRCYCCHGFGHKQKFCSKNFNKQ